MQIYDERGNIIIQDYINPYLMKGKVVLPNGNEITARQYIQEIVVPHIPESGTFKLKNGVEISARQFIEEFVMFDGQTKYKGDIEALIKDTIADDNEEPAKKDDGRIGPGMAQEYGLSESQRKEKEAETAPRDDKDDKISIENIKATRKAREPEISEVRTENKKLSDNITNSRSFAQSLRNKTPEERQALENARRQRMAQNGEQTKRNASGQSR